jgi:O-methyltransferase
METSVHGNWQENASMARVRSLLRKAARLVGLEVVRSSAYQILLNEIARLREEKPSTPDMLQEYQLKLERKADYQSIITQDQIRVGMADVEPDFWDLYVRCKDYTMTSWERLYALYTAVLYIVANAISGDFVECGVWRGGSMRLVAMTLMANGVTDRTLYLYDTFEGMTEPGDMDVDVHGNRAVDEWKRLQQRGVKWAYATIEEVRETMASTGYPMEKVQLVKGPVESTIPAIMPERIVLLRLDTDWYNSTKHEIEHLYPRLSREGVLAVDDFGHYRGSRRGIEEFFKHAQRKPLLHRTDYSCRFAVKP